MTARRTPPESEQAIEVQGHRSHSSKSRIAFITQWFPPEPAGVAANIYDALAADSEVVALTGIPNYPAGRTYEGYSSRYRGMVIENGRRVVRTPLYPSHDRSAIRRFLNYASWAISAAYWGSPTIAGADLSLVYSSPATASLPALVGRFLHRTPYILIIQDLWPDSIFATGFLNRGLLRQVTEALVGRFASMTYRFASAIVVISPTMQSLLLDRGVPSSKIRLVYNWADEGIYRPAHSAETARAELRVQLGLPDDAFVVLYAGNIGRAQGLEPAIEAMKQLGNGSRAHLVLVGEGVSRSELKDSVTTQGLRNVHFVPAMPPTELISLIHGADVCLVSLRDEPLFRMTMPGKVGTLLAAGKPVIMSVNGDAGDLVRKTDTGWAVAPGSPTELAAAIRSAMSLDSSTRDAIGLRARKWYEANMSESIGRKRLNDIMRQFSHSNETSCARPRWARLRVSVRPRKAGR